MLLLIITTDKFKFYSTNNTNIPSLTVTCWLGKVVWTAEVWNKNTCLCYLVSAKSCVCINFPELKHFLHLLLVCSQANCKKQQQKACDRCVWVSVITYCVSANECNWYNLAAWKSFTFWWCECYFCYMNLTQFYCNAVSVAIVVNWSKYFCGYVAVCLI